MKCGDCPKGWANDGDWKFKDIDECKKDNGGCHHARKCVNTMGSNKCEDCKRGWLNVGDKDCEESNMVLDGKGIIPMEWIKDSNKEKLGKLLYMATKDGWNSNSNWHPKVDDQGPTLTVFLTDGGYILADTRTSPGETTEEITEK